MDTGVLSIIMNLLPWQFRDLGILATIMFVFNLVLFTVFTPHLAATPREIPTPRQNADTLPRRRAFVPWRTSHWVLDTGSAGNTHMFHGLGV